MKNRHLKYILKDGVRWHANCGFSHRSSVSFGQERSPKSAPQHVPTELNNTDHINIWITAQTQKSKGRNRGIDNIHQHGVKRLRELIFELAVRGKLVPQDQNDEPASILLKKIAVEKEKLIVEGKIKKQNPLPKITSDEKPFKLPEGWEFERWDTIALKIGDIDHMMPEEKTIGYPYVSPRDFLPNNRIDLIRSEERRGRERV